VVYLSLFDRIDDDLWNGAPVVLPVSALGSGAAFATDALSAVPQTSVTVLPKKKHIEVLKFYIFSFRYKRQFRLSFEYDFLYLGISISMLRLSF
jgi:hypothetical protein